MSDMPHSAEIDAPDVMVGTLTRHYLKCEVCQLTPMFWGQGYATLEEAEDAAVKHRQAHESQPYCICDTVPSINFYDDGDEDAHEPDTGHGHCRHQGRCCECGCMTKRTRPTPLDVTRE